MKTLHQMIKPGRQLEWLAFMTWVGKKPIPCLLAGISLIALNTGMAFPGGLQVRDSTITETFAINPRINSAGYFPFTGSLVNQHLNADVNFFYERQAVGAFLYKCYDLVDPHSNINYLQPGVFATLKLNPKFKLRGFFGYLLSQTNAFCDQGSDFYSAATAYWTPVRNLNVEYTSLFYDYTIKKKLANRLLVKWSPRKFRLELFVWQRTVLDEGENATSASLAFTYPKIKLSKSTELQFTSAYLGYLTHAKPSYALRKGFLFTLAVPISVVD